MFLRTKAFTLIELMITLAIGAILASISIPAYQDYVRKTRVAEALALAKPIQDLVVSNAVTGRPLFEGLRMPDLSRTYLQSITLHQEQGIIWLNFKPTKFNGNSYSISLIPKDKKNNSTFAVLEGSASGTVIPTGNIVWACRSQATVDWNKSSMPGEYVPESCKGRAYL